MPKYQEESFTAGDQSWIGDTSTMYAGRTETLDISAFTANTHYPAGYIPSGTPLAKVGGLMVPYTSGEATTTNAGILAGFLLTDQRVPSGSTADIPAPLYDHGRVKVSKVPVGSDGAFVAPVLAAKKPNLPMIFLP